MNKFPFIGATVLLASAMFIGGCGGGGDPTRPARYQIEVNNGWGQIADEKPVAGFLESAWHDPVGPLIAVNTRLADETGSPMANAQLAQIQTSKLPDYHERQMKGIRLGGRPAVSWGFDLSKEESRLEFFFEECSTSFIVRGSMTTASFVSYARSFRSMASTIKADCDE